MRRLSIVLLASMALAAWGQQAPESSPAEAPAKTGSETTRLDDWFEARWEEQLDFTPTQKTVLGRKEAYDQIDDCSEAGDDARLAWRRRSTAELKQTFDYERLAPEERISYDIWVYELDRAERALPFRRRHYVFTQMFGLQAFLPQFLIAFHKVDETSDMEAYVARIAGISRCIDQRLERAKVHASEGVRPPRFAYEAVIAQARGIVTGAPFGGEGDSPLAADANAKIDALRKGGAIDEATAQQLGAAARRALVDSLKPSYDALIAWFEQDLPNADVEARGVGALPQGRAFYDERLAEATTTGMSADEVHVLGLAEVARIQGEMEAIRKKVGFEGTLQELFGFMREDPRFFFPDTDEGREGYLQAARDHLAFIGARLPDFFGILPKAALEVKRVEAFREQPDAAQHYFPGTPDGSRPGVYYAHLADMRAYPKHQVEVVAYHEGNPGHHMQISIAQELQTVPAFRTQTSYNAYAEGWGLYAELLAKEMGAYQDPYSDLGRLSTEIWRAIRLVVDSGIHAKGWTEQQAVDYFIANSPSAEGAIRSEIQRYFVWPGQATAYKVGMARILELRERARAALGERFDIKGFHDTVLGGGAMPLDLLERRVEDWIAARKVGPS
jgi:uncharacterized protein (DUF885 family)